MQHRLLFGFLVLFTLNSVFSQNSKFSVEANYPITIDDNFLGKDSYGIIDLGLKYRFAEVNPLKIGVSLNGSVLIDNSNQNAFPQDYLMTTYIIQPKIFTELDLETIDKFHPFFGLGYTFMNFQLSGSNNGMDLSGESEKLSGIGFNFGVAYDISDKVFAQVQYDFTRLNLDDVHDIKFNRNVNLLKIGIGLKI